MARVISASNKPSKSNKFPKFQFNNFLLSIMCMLLLAGSAHAQIMCIADAGAGFETDQDTAIVTGNVLTNDLGAGRPFNALSFDSGMTSGSVSFATDVDDTATFDYDPNGQFDHLALGDSDVDIFDYTAEDSSSNTDSTQVVISVNGLNDAPVAVDDSGTGFSTGKDSTFTTGNVQTNDTDVDDGAVLSITAFTPSVGGALVVNNGDGTFNYDPNGQFAALLDGTSTTDTFTYTLEDEFGASDVATVTITITAPAKPSGLDLVAGSDTGTLSTDNITNDNTPDITGSSDPLAVIELTSDMGGVVGTTTADGSGSWTITTSALSDNTHSLTATAELPSGTVSGASVALVITVDTAAPAIPSKPDLEALSDTGVSDIDEITKDDTPDFSGTSDASVLVEISSSVDDAVGSVTSTAGGTWTITASTLSEGGHAITAIASDTAGNTSAASPALSVTIDTTISDPSTPDLNAASDTGASSTDNVTSDNTPTFDGTGDVGDTVTITAAPGGVLGTTGVDGSGNWSFTPGMLADGTIDITAQSSDMAGNTSSSSVAISVTIDTAAPATPSVPDLNAADDSGVSNTDNLTNVIDPQFDGTSDSSVLVSLSSSVLGALGSTTASVGGVWSFTVTTPTLTEVAHDITATATDLAGNSSAASAALSVVVDITAPTTPSTPDLEAASDSGDLNFDDITNDNTPDFSGTSAASVIVEILSDVEGGVVGSTTADGLGNWTITTSTLTDDDHSITARASDDAGNASAESIALSPVTIDTMVSAPSTPDLNAASDNGASNTDNVTNDDTPTFDGTSADPGDDVILTSDVDGDFALDVADGSGNWSATPPPLGALAEGAHSITARADDIAGNVAFSPGALSVTIDLTAPSAPSAPDLNAASDTGASNIDNVTNDTTPDISGTAAEASSTVSLISDEDGSVGSATADGSGNWTVTATLTENTHSITATATDLAGNTGAASTALSPLVIDITPPATPTNVDLDASSDTGDFNNDNITSDTTALISGLTDAGVDVTLTSSIDLTIGTATSNGLGIFNITTDALSEGAHDITSVATDLAGNSSAASVLITVTVDTTAPAVPSTPNLDASSDLGSSSTDDITSDNTPSISGTGAAGSLVRLTSDVNGFVASVLVNGAGNWTVSTSALNDGTHSITATASDNSGNTSVPSAALSLMIETVVPAAPSAPDLAAGSDTGTSSTDNITSDNTPTFAGTAVVGATVNLTSSVNGSVGSAVADGSGNWSITASALSNGSHNVTAAVTTVAGNTSASSAALAVTIDTSVNAPLGLDLESASDTGDSNNDEITSDNTPTISGTADAGDTITLTSSINGTVGTATVNGLGVWSITASTLSAGAHSLTAVAVDTSGNTSSASSALSVTVDRTVAAPAGLDLDSLSDTGSSSFDDITGDNTPTINGTSEANATVRLSSNVNGTVGLATADGSGNWSVTTSAIVHGTHILTAAATDVAGNISLSSLALSIQVDTVAPSAPLGLDLNTVSDTGSSTTDDNTSDNTPTISGTAEANSTVELIADIGGSVGTTTADGSGNWTVTASTLADGIHSLTATATDTAGNTSAASSALSIEVDTAAPAAPAGLDLNAASDSGNSDDDDITSDSTPTIDGTAEANSTVELTSDVEGVVGSATADGSGNWSITASTLSDGTQNLTTTATDTAGNTSAASSALTVEIDTTAPAAPAGLDLDTASDSGSSHTDNNTSETSPTIRGTAEANSTVDLTSSLNGLLGNTSVDGSGNWIVVASAMIDGVHSVTATSTDTAGNISTASTVLLVTIDTHAPAAPTGLDLNAASDHGSSSTDNITNDTTPTIDGAAEAGATVALTSSVDGVVGTATADGSGIWSVTTSALSAGDHTLTATATDAAGNASAASSGLTITINTSVPAAPAGLDLESDSDTGASDTDDITSDNTLTISGTAEANSTVRLTSDIDGFVNDALTDGSGHWTLTTVSLVNGVHVFTAIATDVAGNESPVSAPLQVSVVAADLSFLWNSNLNMQNVVALRNTSDTTAATFDVFLRDMSGAIIGTLSSLSIPAGGELDILLETIPGFIDDSFGTLTIVRGNADSLDGHGCKYSFSADGSSQVETCSPLSPVLKGEAFLGWNTANPTQNPAKLGNPVLNFLSIANDLNSPQSFTVEVYDSTNPASVELMSTRIANVPADGRVDLAISGTAAQLFGTVRVIPSDLTAPYRAEISRYSVADASTLDIDFGLALGGRPGSDNDHVVPVSTSASGEDYLVITNADTAHTNSVSVNVMAEDGTVFGPVNVNLAPYAQSHILINSLLPAGMSGVAQIASTDPVIVDNTVYFRDASSGNVTGAYADEGRDSFGGTVFESQNSFIGHGVFVKLFNVTSGSLSVDLTLNRQSGSALGMSTFTLPAGTGLTVSVNSLPYFNGPNTVGVLKAEVVGGGDDDVLVDVLRLRLDSSGNVDGIEQLSAR